MKSTLHRKLDEFEGVRIEKLPDWQLGWLAGMLDGEGMITIHRDGGPIVNITSTTPIGPVLECMTGIGSTSTQIFESRKPLYRWQVTSVAAVYKLLLTLFPYLLIKGRQCTLVLKYCEERFTEDYYHNPINRENYIKEIRELNFK